jgi:PAS domain S-box-containing protein
MTFDANIACVSGLQNRYQKDSIAVNSKQSSVDTNQNVNTKLQLLNNIIGNSSDFIAALDSDFRYVLINNAYRREFENVFGVKVEVGMSVVEALGNSPDELTKAFKLWQRAVNGEQFTVIEEFGSKAPNVYYEITFNPIQDENGVCIGSSHIVKDVTTSIRAQEEIQLLNAQLEEQKKTLRESEEANGLQIAKRKSVEANLRETEEYIQLAAWAADMGLWSWNPNTDEAVWNDKCKLLFGFNLHRKISYEVFINAVHPEDRERVNTEVKRSLAENVGYDIEYRVIWPDDSIHWLAAKGRVLYDEQGQALSFIGINRDITARKQQQERYTNQLRGLSQAALAINSALSIHEVIKIITEQARLIINAHQSVTSVTINENWSQKISTVSLSDKYAAYRDYNTPIDGSGIYRCVCNENRVMRLTQAELEAHPNWLGFGKEAGKHPPMRGWLAAPLVGRDGRNIGLIQLSDKYDGEFTEEDEQIIVQLAQMASVALENARLYEAEQLARNQSETANRIKDEFLAILSHELRSPLNPILGWSKILQTRKLSEAKTAEALAIIERNAKLQSQLIDDLLDVARILRGKLTLNKSGVNLISTIEAAIETMRLAAEAKNIDLRFNISGNFGHQVLGDSNRLQQVVWNLVSNAIKFTPVGGNVHVELQKIENYAQITVSDNGKGINPDFLPHVFEYFRQADSATTRKFGGLGLGLAIVRNIVEIHGGCVQAESLGEGMGATFTVKLPLSKNQQSQRSSDGDETDKFPVSLNGRNILLVDDDEDSREFISFVLTAEGATVTAASSATEALEILQKSSPDILISDIGMPEMDGYMLMKHIRSLTAEKGGTIPAIAVTAYAGDSNQKLALDAGFQMHISKPVEPTELIKVTTNLIRNIS